MPGQKATVIWPFGPESRPILTGIGGLPAQSGSNLAAFLAGVAVLTFAAALAALLAVAVPAEWFPPLVAAGTLASIALFILFAGPWSIVPIAVNAALLWGVLGLHWTVPMLRGG